MEKLFREKEWVLMKIVNRVIFHQSESYFILLDQFGNKHLMNSNYYKNYGLEIGMEIRCRIDKINCKGKIFFEPEHPYYKENECFEFEKKLLDNGEIIWIDVFGNECVLEGEANSNTKVFKVSKIKKGKVYISLK